MKDGDTALRKRRSFGAYRLLPHQLQQQKTDFILISYYALSPRMFNFD